MTPNEQFEAMKYYTLPQTWLASSSATTTLTCNATFSSTAVGDYSYDWQNDYSPRVQLGIGARGFLLPKDHSYELPDGACLRVDEQGNYRLEDRDAQVIYRACRIREFNPYINASDLIAKFIRYVGTLRVRPDQVAHLPLGLFVNWLVVEAAEMDAVPVPAEVVPVPKNRLLKATVSPRCLWDGKFVPRGRAFAYCNPSCATRHYEKVAA